MSESPQEVATTNYLKAMKDLGSPVGILMVRMMEKFPSISRHPRWDAQRISWGVGLYSCLAVNN